MSTLLNTAGRLSKKKICSNPTRLGWSDWKNETAHRFRTGDEPMTKQKQHPNAPQITVTRKLDRLTISADVKVQARQYESVGALRSYSANVVDGGDDDIERDMIEQAVAVAALTTDIQLAVGFGQAPRFRDLWNDWAHLCPEKWRAKMNIADIETEESLEHTLTRE